MTYKENLIMATESQMAFNYKALYNAARSSLIRHDGGDGDDVDAIKTVRDGFVYQNFQGRNYRDLTYDELKYATYLLNNPNAGNARISSIANSQLQMLKFYIIGIGLRYTDFSAKNWLIDDYAVDAETGRAELIRKFNNKEKLPKAVIAYMYNSWINPKCNEWLVEGGYKKWSAHKEVLYYEQLSVEAAQYLIKRFMQMWNEINKRDSESHVYDYSKN